MLAFECYSFYVTRTPHDRCVASAYLCRSRRQSLQAPRVFHSDRRTNTLEVLIRSPESSNFLRWPRSGLCCRLLPSEPSTRSRLVVPHSSRKRYFLPKDEFTLSHRVTIHLIMVHVVNIDCWWWLWWRRRRRWWRRRFEIACTARAVWLYCEGSVVILRGQFGCTARTVSLHCEDSFFALRGQCGCIARAVSLHCEGSVVALR